MQENWPTAKVVMIQYNMKRDLHKFGEWDAMTMEKGVRQLLKMDSIEPHNPKDNTKEDQHASLGYLIFLKEKRDGSINGRGCCDGRKQRDYMTKE